MNKRETILTLILFLAISWLSFSLQEENHAKEIDVLQNRIMLLEQIIENYEVTEVMRNDIVILEAKARKIETLDQEWLEWIANNQWVLGIEWGE